MKSSADVLIVGTGHAGAQAAVALRQGGFEGSVCIVGEEVELPYERPALSKDYLAGSKPFERMLIRPETFWSERRVVLMRGRRVVSVDPQSQRVGLDDGDSLGYSTPSKSWPGQPMRRAWPPAAQTSVL